MAWLILVASGVLEAIWATALGKSEGFSKLGPSVVFGVAVVLSMIGLAVAMRSLPTGTAYAVWVGITGAEAASFLKVVFLVGIVGCVVGLKVLH
jgi:quaternary ammonium compound-resistance protein SugE